MQSNRKITALNYVKAQILPGGSQLLLVISRSSGNIFQPLPSPAKALEELRGGITRTQQLWGSASLLGVILLPRRVWNSRISTIIL